MIEINDALLALLGILVTAAGSFFALRGAWRRDKVDKEAGIQTRAGQSVGQAIAGMDALVKALQARVENLEGRLDNSEQAEAECKREIEVLARRIATLTEGAP